MATERRVADLEKEVDDLNHVIVLLLSVLSQDIPGTPKTSEKRKSLRQAIRDGKKIRPEIVKLENGGIELNWHIGGSGATVRVEGLKHVKGRGQVFQVTVLQGEVDVGHRLRQASRMWEVTGIEGSSASEKLNLVVKQVDGPKVDSGTNLINTLLEKV